MKILLPKLKQFQNVVYGQNQELFQELAQGQSPHTLMITCSDSRIDPNMVTQTAPGEVFIIRNAGNIIPPYGTQQGGEEASIEFAIDGLKIPNIVVCGHSSCGAMNALIHPETTKNLPAVNRWLMHAEATRRCCETHAGHLHQVPLNTVVEENVKTQINNLKTHPSVMAAIKNKKVNIFGWVYHIETGVVSILNPKTNKYVPSVELDEKAFDLSNYAI
jgi:carbonic anhydrase